MANFQLPDFGILLDCHPKTMDTLPRQAFAINLSDNVIEDMIKCFQDGQSIELSTGSNPSFLYGSQTQSVIPTPEPFLFDLFVTRPEESLRKAAKYPNSTMGILKTKGIKNGPIRVEKVPIEKSSRSAAGKTPAPPKSKATNKHLSGTSAASSSTPRSLPASPLSVAGSPSLNPTLSASQQAVSRAKEQRFPIVHELAVREQTEEYLLKKWKGAKEDFKPALEKAADFSASSGTWSLKKNIWKELDVYKYDYESSEDRQIAIDSAIKQYDRIRLSATDPEWQRLLPFEDRGKGKCLSKLQAEIAKASAAPKIKVQKTEVSQESGTSTDELKSEARSASQPPRLKGTNVFNGGGTTTKKKAASKTRTKATTTKTSTKSGAKEKPRVLSAAYITNSDDDGSEDEPLSKVRNTTSHAAAAAPSQKNVKVPLKKPKPLPSLPAKPAASIAGKRARDEDDSSSSSGAPLSKRYKAPNKDPASSVIRAPINKVTSAATKKPHRASDASSHSRMTSNSVASSVPASKAIKTTSPTKSSPLASSPPTNASDLDGEGETPPPPPVPKRYGHSRVGSANSVSNKRRRQDDDDQREKSKKLKVTMDVVQMANRFKAFYQTYESLHFELKDLDDPPESKIADLLEMRTRLEAMKKEIYQGVGEGKD